METRFTRIDWQQVCFHRSGGRSRRSGYQQNAGTCDSWRLELTGVKFGMIIWTLIGRSCLGLLQTETMSKFINEVVKQSKQCCDRRTIQPDLCCRSSALIPQRRMIVYYDRHDQFQQVPCGDFPREGLTGANFGVKIWKRIGRSCLSLLDTKTMLNINEENKF